MMIWLPVTDVASVFTTCVSALQLHPLDVKYFRWTLFPIGSRVRGGGGGGGGGEVEPYSLGPRNTGSPGPKISLDLQ